MLNNIHRATLVVLSLCGTAAPAFAHAHLKSAAPPLDGSVKEAPTEIDLTFSEGVNLRFTGVTVTGPDGRTVQTGEARHGAGDTTLVVPLASPLAPGRYKVEWHALASDGHRTSGGYSITVSP